MTIKKIALLVVKATIKSPLIGRTIPVWVDDRQVLGTIELVGKGTPFPPETLVVRYELNGGKDWTFLPERILRHYLEFKTQIYA